MLPSEIETKSFAIIEEEARGHGFEPDPWKVVSRMIHTSADFDYLTTVRFHSNALAVGIKAIQSGQSVITDTQMAMAGIRKKNLAAFGCPLACFIGDPDVAKRAQQEGTTRAKAAVDAAVEIMQGGIYVIGNAPTALLHLIRLVREQRAQPALIVGLPVGFVNAAESKAELLKLECPYITNTGRKGGSNVAAAVVNALIELACSQPGGEKTRESRKIK